MKNMIPITSTVTLLAFCSVALAQQQNSQPSTGGQNSAAGADIQVQQPAPNVTVQQPAPDVTVQRPAPEVTVQQPEPNVTVQQAKPNVTVEQAKPDVTVEQTGEPNVNVVRPDQQNSQQQNSQRTGGSNANQQPQNNGSTETRLMANQVQGLIGTDAVTTNNEDIGEIENLLIGSDGRVEAAIVEWGGFLGIGSRTAAVPWSDLRLNQGGDRIVIDMTRQEMEALPAYNGDPASVAGIDADAKPVQ
jgi:hypothetical protein